MNSEIDVSVIIVNYNTLKMTSECIDSIIKHTENLNYEIILVDNASSDGSKDFFEHDKRIKYIYSSQNLGFGRANNLGYSYSKGKFIFLLNSDTILLNNAIKFFLDFANNEDVKYACLGSMLLNTSGEYIHSYADLPKLTFFIKKYLNEYTRLVGVDLLHNYFDKIPETYPLKVGYITGADLFIRREVIEKNGLFNPRFFMYYEETDMQNRYSRTGNYSYIIEGPKIIHLCGGSQKKSLLSWMRDIIGSLSYTKENFSSMKYYMVKSLAIMLLTPKILVHPSKWNDKLLGLKALIRKP